jgi:hypothetical protein
VLRRYEHEESFAAAPVDAAAYRRLECWAFGALPDGFVEIVLAPHAPLGTSSVLADLSQDRVLSTIADSEIVSDSTNVLALEAARRRRARHVDDRWRRCGSRRRTGCCAPAMPRISA